jgi:hypothetical protein
MRNRLTSGLLPRLAITAAMLAVLPSLVCAWDEDRVQSQIQPYFGVWGGVYMVERQDLRLLVDSTTNDFFSAARPAMGLSMGVAYGRLHVGINGGYQLIDGDYNPMTIRHSSPNQAYTYISKSFYYRYQVIPIDISIDVALLPNEYPVNLLLGGSVGLGLVGMQMPFKSLIEYQDTTMTVTELDNDWNYNNAMLATGYLGARINLARRLNLEGQIGYRFLKSNEVEMGHGYELVRPLSTTYDDSGSVVEQSKASIPIDLSAPYVRVDIRWTFASESEKDVDRSAARSKEMTERLAMMPHGRRID